MRLFTAATGGDRLRQSLVVALSRTGLHARRQRGEMVVLSMYSAHGVTGSPDSDASDQFWRWSFSASAFVLILAVGFAVFSFRPQLVPTQYSSFVIPSLLAGLTCAVTLHFITLAKAREDQRKSDLAFDTTDREFAGVFQNTLDGILILDDRGVCLDANPATFTILGTSTDHLIGQPLSGFYQDVTTFNREWIGLQREVRRRGRTNLVRGDGAKVCVEYTCTANFVPGRHLLVLCDTTRRDVAENEVDNQLSAANSARAETEAFRRSTFALTQNLAMDTVLDTLLGCLADLVPYSTASVLLVEDFQYLFVARKAPKESTTRNVVTLAVKEVPILLPILVENKSLFVTDTREDKRWREHPAFADLQSWLGVPLLASGQPVGVLSVGSNTASKFTQEHFRLTKSLAIPTAAAIQNARHCERAEIYAAELRLRLNDVSGSR